MRSVTNAAKEDWRWNESKKVYEGEPSQRKKCKVAGQTIAEGSSGKKSQCPSVYVVW